MILRILIIGILFIPLISCGTYEPKKTTGISTTAADYSIDIKNPSFNLKNPSKVILYTVTQSRSEEELLKRISELISEKGVDIVLDFGQLVDYGDETYRIRIKEKHMSLHQYLEVVAPGIKENEPVILEIKADTTQRLIEILMKLMFD